MHVLQYSIHSESICGHVHSDLWVPHSCRFRFICYTSVVASLIFWILSVFLKIMHTADVPISVSKMVEVVNA